MPGEIVEVNEISGRDWEEDQRREKLRVKLNEKKLSRESSSDVCVHMHKTG